MINYIKISFFLTLALGFSDTLSQQSQQHSLGIYLSGKKIGEINASLSYHNGVESYRVKSNANFRVLWKKYHRETEHRIKYKDRHILESYSIVKMNENLEDSSVVFLNGSRYEYFRYPDEKFSEYKHQINTISVMMYFKEPLNISAIYSERFLSFCDIIPLGEGKYKVLLPNNKENIYTYQNGKLVEVYIDRAWFNLTFK